MALNAIKRGNRPINKVYLVIYSYMYTLCIWGRHRVFKDNHTLEKAFDLQNAQLQIHDKPISTLHVWLVS